MLAQLNVTASTAERARICTRNAKRQAATQFTNCEARLQTPAVPVMVPVSCSEGNAGALEI